MREAVSIVTHKRTKISADSPTFYPEVDSPEEIADVDQDIQSYSACLPLYLGYFLVDLHTSVVSLPKDLEAPKFKIVGMP
jgi:hypothetical protein